MANRYDAELSALLVKLDEISQSLRWADSASLGSSPIQKQVAQLVISTSYVLAAAAIEEYMREMVNGLCREICKAKPTFSALRSSLVSVFAGSQISSMRDLKDYEKIWEKRREFSNLFSSTSLVDVENTETPIDGKTIRPVHVETIWQVFGFEEQPFTSALYRASLTDIADGRNDVAHGHTSIKKFAHKKGAPDTDKKIQRIQELALHFTIHAERYIEKKLYLKST